MTFPVTEYIPSFHVPVDFPHKMQIAQALQGWFEDVGYLILIELWSKNIQGLFLQWLRNSKISDAKMVIVKYKSNKRSLIWFLVLEQQVLSLVVWLNFSSYKKNVEESCHV